jgi:hypothetical protein
MLPTETRVRSGTNVSGRKADARDAIVRNAMLEDYFLISHSTVIGSTHSGEHSLQIRKVQQLAQVTMTMEKNQYQRTGTNDSINKTCRTVQVSLARYSLPLK